MVNVSDLALYIESLYPINYQENYDNSGLIIGKKSNIINGIIVCLDLTTDVLDEAIKKKCNFILTHHPIIFNGLKKIIAENNTQIIVEKCIKNDINVYSLHTNFDKAFNGMNSCIASKLLLKNIKILQEENDVLRKLTTFCPIDYANKIRNSLFEAGAGFIGKYESTSFNSEGIGTFKATGGGNPFVGKIGEPHFEKEIKIETIYPIHLEKKIINTLVTNHPYEEVAYDIYKLENKCQKIGLGVIGDVETPISINDFLKIIKDKINKNSIRYSGNTEKLISKVAICGGSGANLIPFAYNSGADIYITSDIKYHEFDHQYKNFILVDGGHYETEILFKDFFIELLKKKFINFAIHFAESEKNHIRYY